MVKRAAPPASEPATASAGLTEELRAIVSREYQALKAELQNWVAAQNDKIKAQSDEIKAQSDKIKAHNDEIKAQNDKIQEQDHKIKAQGDDIKALKFTVDAHDGEIAKLGKEVARFQADNLDLKRTVNAQHHASKADNARIAKLEENLEKTAKDTGALCQLGMDCF